MLCRPMKLKLKLIAPYASWKARVPSMDCRPVVYRFRRFRALWIVKLPGMLLDVMAKERLVGKLALMRTESWMEGHCDR